MIEFIGFGKIPRYSREVVVTEKIDGTNAQIYIEQVEPVVTELALNWISVTKENQQFRLLAGSKKRWLTSWQDNFGFWKWVYDNAAELIKLGPGRHFGEWWGQGIQRNYGLRERRFSLFNRKKWSDPLVRPSCCDVVPMLWQGQMDELNVPVIMLNLGQSGSIAMPGYRNPEGIVIYHTLGNVLFKKTFEDDDKGKEWHERDSDN